MEIGEKVPRILNLTPYIDAKKGYKKGLAGINYLTRKP